MRYAAYVDGGLPTSGLLRVPYGGFAVYGLEGLPLLDNLHDLLRWRCPIHVERRFSLLTGATPHMAELGALFVALSWCCENGVLRRGNVLNVFMDTRSQIERLKGFSEVLERNARDMISRIDNVVRRSEGVVRYRWIPGGTMKRSELMH